MAQFGNAIQRLQRLVAVRLCPFDALEQVPREHCPELAADPAGIADLELELLMGTKIVAFDR
jgi:hypothetical protein